MKSNLTEKLLSICGDASKTYGCFDSTVIIKLTEEQRIRIEAELIEHLGFDKIVWMDLPAGLSEGGAKAIAVKTTRILDQETPPHKGQVGYVHTIIFTPKMYDPMEMYQPVKDGCVFAPTTYNAKTFEPTQSITLTWSPGFAQDFPTNNNEEMMKQSLRERLEKVLENPEEYKPNGFIGCLLRYAAV
jgi:hypothetical protein